MNISGDFESESDYERCLEFLGDINNIMSCMPLYDISISDKINAKIKIDLSFLNMDSLKSITGRLSFNYIKTGNVVSVNGTGRAAGASIKFKIEIIISSGDKTRIIWNADFDPGIILKLLGSERVYDASRINIENAIKCIKLKMDNL
ncbi:CoxG family protein [Picrophilus oshimae]|uniref:Carbon monoxide dehydrogenase subunit G n=1 Tax=Picrophilus torridus (strain ATCC 700027 / DSM 9790 / JCM 10055 / NBRC 100828 / KAW 2/3) TaxID=1122961 RepID=Q6KYY2_PICTO|nr:SRPBCC domain-containing protein [Picrophilus oshimae]AAT44070.1 hypothetical protein PTO1485 [Picrophilus oshimae DSM 9789]SMD30861.1 hypothetical protein SAMN02745355_0776 [Picrophilus oshimae DSM 9789]